MRVAPCAVNPKSVRTARKSDGSGFPASTGVEEDVSRTLDGLKSRWTTPRWWA